MRNRYTYCPSAHEALLECKPAADVAGLAVSLADLVERECAGISSGVDKLGIINLRKDGKECVDGDEYFSRFHTGESEVDILMGVTEKTHERILIADCKLQMKGGASIANRKNLPNVCENIYCKYCSAKKNIEPIRPITPMYVIFNHAIASVARRYLDRCKRGTKAKCRLTACFHFECLTIEDFGKLVA